ncbi:MAG: hypothetical protein RR942_09595 [Romboutsia sp.]
MQIPVLETGKGAATSITAVDKVVEIIELVSCVRLAILPSCCLLAIHCKYFLSSALLTSKTTASLGLTLI